MAKGFIQKAGDFLGVSKFGKALGTAARVATGEVGRDIEQQNQQSANIQKILYASRQEKDPAKRSKLIKLAKNLGTGTNAADIDPGLSLSKREVIGSAANVGLNVLTPGAFKGSKAAIVGKNALLGGGFGAASGLEKKRSATGVVGSATGGALVGAGIGAAGIAAKAAKDFFTKATPKWLMDKAIRPSLDETRKTIKYGNKSIGQELLEEGVAGSPEKLLKIADTQLTSLEKQLQDVLSDPRYADKLISKEQLAPYLKELLEAKAGTPGLKGDVQRIKVIFDDIPEQLTLQEANQMKRRIYNELRDVSYKLDAKLSNKAGALKLIAKGLKSEIESAVGGTTVGDINKKLSLYGRLENNIVDQMARSMRNNSFGLTDAILTAGGVATLNPVGFLGALGAAGVRHAGGSTTGRTYAAKALNKLSSVGTGKAARFLKGAVKRTALNRI